MSGPWEGRQVPKTGRFSLLTLVLTASLFVVPLLFPPNPSSASAAAGTGVKTLTFTLDNVAIQVSAPFLPSAASGVSEPGNASQVATFADWRPFKELSITAIPFGTKPGTETVPEARAGGAAAYREALRKFRAGQGGILHDGATAEIFGQRVTGQSSVVELYLYGGALKRVQVVEWVVEAGKRLWIVRVSQERNFGQGEAETGSSFAAFDGGMVISSTTLDAPSSLVVPANGASANPKDGALHASKQDKISPGDDLPYPTWWNGSDCDYDHYYGSSGLGSYRLGATYLGMTACGPRPIADGAPDVLVNFFPGSWGEFDFECVELAMRYLYLAYAINPYQANGNTVVGNYRSSYGGNLRQIANGTIAVAPQAGDVLSYGPTSTFGHASVVSNASVDGSGNGSVTVIEENNAASGESTLSVTNWLVAGNAGSVSGWLTTRG